MGSAADPGVGAVGTGVSGAVSGNASGNAGASGGPTAGASVSGVASVGAPAAATTQGADAYALHGIYFRRDAYQSVTDCLNAAAAKRLPLALCN